MGGGGLQSVIIQQTDEGRERVKGGGHHSGRREFCERIFFSSTFLRSKVILDFLSSTFSVFFFFLPLPLSPLFHFFFFVCLVETTGWLFYRRESEIKTKTRYGITVFNTYKNYSRPLFLFCVCVFFYFVLRSTNRLSLCHERAIPKR